MAYDITWTIERGEESFDILVEYTYKFGTPDSWTEPGDPPEVEIQSVTYGDLPFTLTDEEEEKITLYIYENPPEDDYYPDD